MFKIRLESVQVSAYLIGSSELLYFRLFCLGACHHIGGRTHLARASA
jgi:hypothetical protein